MCVLWGEWGWGCGVGVGRAYRVHIKYPTPPHTHTPTKEKNPRRTRTMGTTLSARLITALRLLCFFGANGFSFLLSLWLLQ